MAQSSEVIAQALLVHSCGAGVRLVESCIEVVARAIRGDSGQAVGSAKQLFGWIRTIHV